MSDTEVLFVRSSKLKNETKSTEGDSSTNDDDIWDDRLLIKAYDKAVQLAQQKVTKNKENIANEAKSKDKKKSGGQKWKVGDKVRCQYSEDFQYYEADIIEILESTGMCVVKYVGYKNEEKVPLKKLKPSEGESARARQCKEALDENVEQVHMEVENDNVSSTGKKSQQVPKKSFNQKKDRQFKKRNGYSESNSFKTFSLPQMEGAVIPPPPPPHMFNRISDDENETEAMSAMLMSWYMSGYHTGYYQGLKMAKKQKENC